MAADLGTISGYVFADPAAPPFPPDAIQLCIGGIVLTEVPPEPPVVALVPGQFRVVDEATIDFRLPVEAVAGHQSRYACSCSAPNRRPSGSRHSPATGSSTGRSNRARPGSRTRAVAHRVAAHLWRAAETGPVGATVTHAEVDLSLDDRDNPSDEADWLAHADYADDRAALDAIETELARGTGSRLSRLCTTFGLSAADRDLLHACLASELDPSLLRVYAYLQDVAARSYVTDALAARLFGHGRSLGTADDSPLLRWAMLVTHETSPGEQAAYRLDRAVYSWLTGNDALDADLAGIARRVGCTDSLEGWPVADTGKELARWLGDNTVATARVRVIGADGSGRRTFAALVADRFGRALLAVDATRVDESAWPHIERAAKRRALLDGTALALSPPPSFWTKLSATTRPAMALQFVVTDTERALPAEAHTVDYTVILPAVVDRQRAGAVATPCAVVGRVASTGVRNARAPASRASS